MRNLLCLLGALLFIGTCSAGNLDLLRAIVEYAEEEYKEAWSRSAGAQWNNLLLRSEQSKNYKLQNDTTYGFVIKENSKDIKKANQDDTNLESNPLLARKFQLLTTPGDVLLPQDSWNELVTFAVQTEHNLETANDYFCGTQPCKLSQLIARLPQEDHKSEMLKSMKLSWEKHLPDDDLYFNKILPMVRLAGELNGYPNSPEDYWNMLVDYEDAVSHSKSLWEDVISPLYTKLKMFVQKKLAAVGRESNENVPTYNLGSLFGDDWRGIAQYVIPKRSRKAFKEITDNINTHKIGGRNAFIKAAHLIDAMSLGKIAPDFWTISAFEQECPARVVYFNTSAAAVRTCSQAGVVAYTDASEILASVRQKAEAMSHSNNTFILMEPNRFSPVFPALSGMVSLVGWSRKPLSDASILDYDRYDEDAKLATQFLEALRDLPRLAYMYCVDDFRLRHLNNEPVSFKEHSKGCRGVETGERDLLGDYKVLKNEPYVGEFLATVLKYQLFNKLAQESYYDEDEVQNIRQNKDQILKAMGAAYSVKPSELIPELTGESNAQIVSDGIANYFGVLDKFLDQPDDNEFGPDLEEHLGHEDAAEKILEEDLIPDHPEDIETDSEKKAEIVEKPGEISLTEPTPEAAAVSQTPWIWIAVGIALAVLCIAIIIIIRKRKTHKRNLQRTRMSGA